MSRNLINFSDLTKKDIFDLIELANNFKSEDALDYRNENLFPDKKIVSMFCEPSTRTKLSFEIAAHNLGAKFIDFDLSNSSMNKGETLEDTLDAMQMMGVDLCILRHTESVIHDFVKHFSNMQFINAGEGSISHPTQTLIDLMTIHESKEKFENLNITIVGDLDHSRVVNSFIEAIQIVRSLITEGTCSFNGSYYSVNAKNLGPLGDEPPLLIGSVGGSRTVREVTPFLDRVEIKASSASTRGGKLDLQVMANIPESHLLSMIEKVQAIRPGIELGMFVLCNAGTDEFTKGLEQTMGDNLYGRFFGSPEKVAEGLKWLAEQGISRAQLSPFDDASLDRLAPLLL